MNETVKIYKNSPIRIVTKDGEPWFVAKDVCNIFVSEAGLYSLILRSRKPEAKAFKRWVTHEVLPSISTIA